MFGRVSACVAEQSERPRALLAIGLAQLVNRLEVTRPDWRNGRVAVVIGTSSGGFAALERWLGLGAAGRTEHQELLRRAAYFAPLSAVVAELGRTPDQLVSLHAACASSTLAIGLALRWLQLGYYDLVIAGGYDAESELVIAGFDALKATSRAVPRPFRAERDGMVLGEGVALLALAREESQPAFPITRGARGLTTVAEHFAKPFGYVEGFGATTDAVHVTAPDRTGAGLARAAQLALEDSRHLPDAIQFVSVHGTATSFNDASEAHALLSIFGTAWQDLPLHAFKSIVGHTLGAAGALETLAALSALDESVLPATLALGSPMPGQRGLLLEQNQSHEVERCLKLSTAFGGANAALVLSGSSSRPSTSLPRAPRPVELVARGKNVQKLALERLLPVLVARVERLPRSDALSLLAISAAAEALHALLACGVHIDPLRTGVVVGSVGATLEANVAFSARVLSRGHEHAEPRRFPATSPNACAGHVAIAFGLKGPSHSVGAGPAAALEALLVAHDWIAAGDADVMLVIAAEEPGEVSGKVLSALGLSELEGGAYAAVLAKTTASEPLERAKLLAAHATEAPENRGFRALEAFCLRAGLRDRAGFGSVRPPE